MSRANKTHSPTIYLVNVRWSRLLSRPAMGAIPRPFDISILRCTAIAFQLNDTRRFQFTFFKHGGKQIPIVVLSRSIYPGNVTIPIENPIGNKCLN